MTELLSEFDMKTLLDGEIESIEPDLKKYATSILIPLNRRVLIWEYGNNKEFLAWEFASLGENSSASYCLGGHGKNGYPWGLTTITDNHFGMANLWFDSFEAMLVELWRQKNTLIGTLPGEPHFAAFLTE